MTTKTFSRARTAKAALVKILAMHEVAEADHAVTTLEVDDNRFTAHVDFIPGYDISLLEADLEGFSWTRPALVTETPVEVAQPAKRRSGYINENSNHQGVCAQVRAIAGAMTSQGATRKEVIDYCRSIGIAYGTARTQFQKWHAEGRPVLTLDLDDAEQEGGEGEE